MNGLKFPQRQTLDSKIYLKTSVTPCVTFFFFLAPQKVSLLKVTYILVYFLLGFSILIICVLRSCALLI